MIITGIVKFYNESNNGNLERCLKQMSIYCNHIICCNDSSTDNSLEIAYKYTNDIINRPNDFKSELQHKQDLLDYLYKFYPKTDIIIHLDPDECLDNISNIGALCDEVLIKNYGGIRAHLLNLWLSEDYYRVDNAFNYLWKTFLWRNTGELRYPSEKKLHQPMHPPNIKNIATVNPRSLQIIHYGFSTPELIARKYKTYKSLGQTGWELSRLIPTHKTELFPLYPGSGGRPINRINKKEWKEVLKKCQLQ